MVDRDGESCFVIIRILCYHRRKAQLACIFTADRHADKPFAVAGHEIHVFRCTELCGTDEIAFIFSVRIVRDDNHMSCAKFFQSLFYSIVLVFLLCHYRKPPIKKPWFQTESGRIMCVKYISSLIQTILSVSESHRICLRLRTVPPIGNFTLPWR